jgi:hypothetical protein
MKNSRITKISTEISIGASKFGAENFTLTACASRDLKDSSIDDLTYGEGGYMFVVLTKDEDFRIKDSPFASYPPFIRAWTRKEAEKLLLQYYYDKDTKKYEIDFYYNAPAHTVSQKNLQKLIETHFEVRRFASIKEDVVETVVRPR